MKTTECIHSSAHTLAGLSALLLYPGSNFFDLLGEVETRLQGQAAEFYSQFKGEACKLSLDGIEEIYTRTFDLAPLCIPYISSYIYGNENFERGALMSNLADRYSQDNYSTNGELPDHLAVVLGFAPHFSKEELKELIEFCLSETVSKMAEALKDADNLYYFLLQSIKESIEQERG